ncbi:UDP-N-acetylmuramoylalanine--D-glutamate ligase [Frankia sp. CcI49]|uniref:UDP-N-acetylmuramoyl-L-alanine--D-glutamate ligase n=1 Tax=Frankia sp. CcI49 TaxID=1745382 RepID=UPI0009773AB6|nr:UDP-N-acetylmuramoyl-L-alanine--D-glutamate ligase [Frankia sp. CcI49]ONH59942.1 UDP-N-acetylmuramoylalanine--D-glutamate ligase [Frankia sp. CcI49]
MRLAEIATRRVGIWGLGLEGRAVLGAVAASPAGVVVVDEREASALAAEPLPGVDYNWGAGSLERLLDCDLVVVSPGIPRTHPFLETLRAKEIHLTSGSAVWLESEAARAVGVTGTKGKSTTASLIHAILSQPTGTGTGTGTRTGTGTDAGAVLAGNIGLPLLAVPPGPATVVAELSSYQCFWITRSPRVAVVTNLYEEHLPWHGSLERYWQDKARIAVHGAAVLVCDEPTLAKLVSVEPRVRELPTLLAATSGEDIVDRDGTRLLTVRELPPHLRAGHLVSSVRLAVLAAGAALETPLSPDAVRRGLAGHAPLPHRLETISRDGGLVWVDDTLSTTANSVIAAVEAFDAEHTILIVGGQDRGISYQPLNDFLLGSPRRVDVIAIPSNGPAVVAEFGERRPDRVHPAAGLREAVALAARLGSPGCHVILSPGAPSYDRYANYAEKSAEFHDAVTRLHPPTP